MKSIFTFIIAAFLLFPLQAQEKVYTVDNPVSYTHLTLPTKA